MIISVRMTFSVTKTDTTAHSTHRIRLTNSRLLASKPMTKINNGFVFGEAYAALLDHAQAEGYALPAVNVSDSATLNATLAAAVRCKSDVIIQLSNGGARSYAGPALDGSIETKVLGATLAAKHVQALAAKLDISVILHTDHANLALLPWIDQLIDASAQRVATGGVPLFSSHMLDLSEESLADNIALSAERLKRLTSLGMGIEIELGVTGGEEDGVGAELDESADNSHLYTQPEDVAQAWQALKPLGHVTVAASFGNVHGVYKPGNVQLRPEILQASQEHLMCITGAARPPVPFVFHGGSGSEKAKITEAISYGVVKMNIDTDTQFAYAQAVGDYVKANPKAFAMQIDDETGKPYKKQYDPRVWTKHGQEGMIERLTQAFHDLGATGRTVAGKAFN